MLVESGTLDRMDAALKNDEDPNLMHLLPAYIKVFGMVARHERPPNDCFERYPAFRDKILAMVEQGPQELRVKGIETVVFVSGAQAKKLALFNRAGLTELVMSAIAGLANRGEAQGFELLSELVEFDRDGGQADLEMELNERLMRLYDADVVHKLAERLRSPFLPLMRASHLVVRSLAGQPWALKEIERCAGMMETLLDAGVSGDTGVLATKRDILAAVQGNPAAASILSAAVMKRVDEYLDRTSSNAAHAVGSQVATEAL